MPTDTKHLKRVRLSSIELAVISTALYAYSMQARGLSHEQVIQLADLIGNADGVIVTPGYTEEV